MLKLICHWTAAMLFCCWTSAMLQCLILRVVLWHCTAPSSCVVALLPDQEVALLLLLHSVPVLRTLYIVQCASTYIAHCYRTSYTATTQPSLHCSCFTDCVRSPKCTSTERSAGRFWIWARVLLEGCWYGLGFGSPYCPPRYMAWRKMLGLAESVRSGISLKIVSPLGPHFDKIRSPSHVASVCW